MTSLLRALLLAACLCPAPLQAQDPVPRPEDVASAAAVDPAELRDAAQGRSATELEEDVAAWLELVRAAQAAVVAAAEAEEGTPERAALADAIAARDAVVERAAVLATALAAQAGDDADARAASVAADGSLAQTGARPPGDPAGGIAVDLDAFGENLAALGTDRVIDLLEPWMAIVERQRDAVTAAQDAPEGSDERARLDALGTDRDALVARCEAILDVLAARPGVNDVVRATVEQRREEIDAMRAGETQEELETSTVPDDMRTAEELDLEVLRAQLRPLRKEQVEEDLAQWLDMLQRKALETRRVEVAALTSEAADDIERYNERAVELRAERSALLRRVEVVVSALEDKGGDVAEFEAYLDSLVVTPPVTGIRAAWVQLRSWILNPDGGIAVGQRILAFFVILIGFRLLAALLAKFVGRAMRAMKKSSALLREFFANTVRNLTMLIGIVVALGQLGVDIGPLLAAIGAAGFVIGFALQGTLSNFASGVLLMIFRPYDVGDIINAAGINGKVGGMNLMSTTVSTFDNQRIIVPNNMIWGDVITNVTAQDRRRVDMVFGIGYADDIGKAEAALKDVVQSHTKVLSDPEPIIRVHELGDSSVNFVVRPWVRTADYWEVYWDITRAVKERFDRDGITIPFPQRDVHLYQASPAPAQ